MSRHTQQRSAFTLIETVISLSIMSVLFLGLSGAVMVGSKAIPTATQTGNADLAVIDSLNQFRSDLRQARKIKIETRAAGTRFTLDMKDPGGVGMPAKIKYTYITSSSNFIRKSDGTGDEEMFANLNGFAMQATTEGPDATVIWITLSVKGTILQYFEMHIVLPDKPEMVL